ncbi:MAG: PKD domain-containing protein, partial [Ilumatobacteraceae bacterium]
RFDASASTDADDSIAHYFWDLGDGSGLIEGAVIEHVYATDGTYSPRLVLIDQAGHHSELALAPITVDVDATAQSAGFVPLPSPVRVLDTRPRAPTIDGQEAGSGRVMAGETIEVTVAGRADIPADATTAVLNLTVADPLAAGYVTVYPCGTTPPNASSLNFARGETRANSVVTPLSPSGTVCLFASGATHLIADVSGTIGGAFVALPAPARLADTRPGTSTIDGQVLGVGRVAGGTVLTVKVAGRAGIDPAAQSVAMNLTVAGASVSGYVTAFPCGQAPPNSSNVNYSADQVAAAGAIVGLDATGRACFYVSTDVHLIVDVAGTADGIYSALAAPARSTPDRAPPPSMVRASAVDSSPPARPWRSRSPVEAAC